ncbi:hypothetical protein J31TS6_56920 [Brevibacillus reuszeri]|uniref:hypothetical protein n=1 Tax=Brevibacillus reuszeri TaxID=54915 RepID=UPI001B2685A7|nr:hypothetical protein [Brevibacillus reuszeri]GIO09664.1 hypothetical protein J31TS6_56920 [Brevibacillus reuszeri]
MALVVKGKVIHNGKLYLTGEEIPGLKETESKRLLQLEVIEVDKKTTKGKNSTPPADNQSTDTSYE